jgi:hypothetical protein
VRTHHPVGGHGALYLCIPIHRHARNPRPDGQVTSRRRPVVTAGILATMLALVVAYLPITANTASAAPARTVRAAGALRWNLPFPHTMSYRVVSEDRALQCLPLDSVFQSEVGGEGLDKYEIDVVDGHRGQCGREKAEQFKRLFPNKMVLLYESTGGADPRTWPGGTWAGYYLMMNRTLATTTVDTAQTAIKVLNPNVFSVGDTAVMWLPTAGDPYANSEWVKVDGISGATLTVTRDLFGTGAHSYASAPLIAAEATGPGYPDPVINFSSMAPVNPATGKRANKWMAANMINDFAPSTADAPTLDGVEFDTASWSPPAQNDNGAVKNIDCDGDGVIDYCNENTGTARQVNAYGVGYDAFIQTVKRGLTAYDTDLSRPPKMVLADGEMGLRSIGSADGGEFESFPTWDNYSYSSPALDTFGVWATRDSAPGPHLSYTFTKDITPVYSQKSPLNPDGCVTPAHGGTCRNGEFRYGMAAALLEGGASAYDNEATFLHPQPWDEEGDVDQSTTGLSPGYLGQPLGPVQRLTRYSTPNLTTNPSFEQDLSALTTSSVVPNALRVTRDTTTAIQGTASLRADVTHQTANPDRSDARLFEGVNGSLSTGEYTVDFWAKAVNNTVGPQALPLGVGVKGDEGAPEVVLLTNRWTHYYLQFDLTTSVPKNAVIRFSLGDQIGSYWLDGIKLHRGTAGILTREFTGGIAVMNDSFTTQKSIPLPDGPYHHIMGVQDTKVNNGLDVGSTLPAILAKDGVILLRGTAAAAAGPFGGVSPGGIVEQSGASKSGGVVVRTVSQSALYPVSDRSRLGHLRPQVVRSAVRP